MASGEFEPNLKGQLNDVALPAGLLPRLYDIAAWGDDELDVRLRDVPLPLGLVDRLTASIADEPLDEQLRDVPFPAFFVERLAESIADEQLDEQLRDVPVPVCVLARSRIIPDRRVRSALRQWSLAASLLLMVGAGTAAWVGGMVWSARVVEPPPLALVVIDQGPLDLISPAESAVAIVADVPAPRARPAGGGFSDETMALLTTFDRPRLGPAGQLAADLRTAWNPWDNWLLKRWGALGYVPAGGAPLPELTALSAPVAQGREAPLVRGHDREFLYAYAVQPPTLTAPDAEARTLDVPLVTETDSFDRALRLAAAGRAPAGPQVRVEHFLSAVQPRRLVEAAPGQVALCTAAGPSVFNPFAAGLLQVGVQAGMPRRRSLAAAHLVLAIDASASMSRSGGLDVVRRAVSDALDYLGPDDRLSLLVFADEVAEIVREVRGDDRAALEEAQRLLDQAAAGGGANLGVALQQAVSVAIESESAARLPRRLVLVTASPPVLADKDANGLRQMFAEAAKGDFRFEICDVAGEDDNGAAWQVLAGSLDGTLRRLRTADGLCWALVEALTGDASLAATEVKMRIEFNPQAVAAYRLIGHESTAFGGLLPAALEADLHVGQGVSALFEIWLYPNDEDDVAEVRVQWTDPASGQSSQVGPQRVSRLQFATALEGAALALQAAAVAAEGAEVLRQSFNFDLVAPDRYRYQPKPGGLHHVLAQADRVAAALARQPRYRRVVDLLGALSGLVGERAAASAHSGVRGIVTDSWREYGSK